MTSVDDKDFYTLNELASSGALPWRDTTTVQKYVEAYSDIFCPKIRGEGRSKRYVINKVNVGVFMKMFINGELRDFKLVRAGLSRTFDDFVTIISADGTDFSKEVREIAEKIDLRTDLVKTNDHKSFMEVLGTSVLTHKAIIIVVNGKDKGIMFHEEKPVTSTDIRRIPYARGLIDKAVLLCSTNSINSNFERAFRFSKVGSYHEITGKGSKKLGEVLAWLKKVKEEGHTFNMPRNLYKMRSSHLGRKPIKKL